MSASAFGPCTVCGADAGGNRMLCSFDDANILQQRAVLCPRCRRRMLRKRLVHLRLDCPWPGGVVRAFQRASRVRTWPHVRISGERRGR